MVTRCCFLATYGVSTVYRLLYRVSDRSPRLHTRRVNEMFEYLRETFPLRLLMQERVTLRLGAFLFNKKLVCYFASHAQRVRPELSCCATGTLTWITILSDFFFRANPELSVFLKPASAERAQRKDPREKHDCILLYFGAPFSTNALLSPDGCCVFKRRREKDCIQANARPKSARA